IGRRTDGSEPAAFTSRRTEVLELEERQAELQHAEDQHGEHADDQCELNGCGPILTTEPLADPHRSTSLILRSVSISASEAEILSDRRVARMVSRIVDAAADRAELVAGRFAPERPR